MAYQVELTEYAEAFIMENISTERVFRRIEQAAQMLAAYPSAGAAYAPAYPAATPPFPCRYLPLADTPFTLYYTKDDEAEIVTIFDIEWSAGDPCRRFGKVTRA